MRVALNDRVPVLSWRLWPTLAIALLVVGCSLTDAEVGKIKKSQPDEPRKVGTGRSFVAETTVETVSVLAAAPGWFSEMVASGQDDWEPAVAVDPGNASLV